MQPTPMSPRNKWFLVGAGAVLVALVVVATIAVTNGDDSSRGVATEPAVTTTVDSQVNVTTETPPQTATTGPTETGPSSTAPTPNTGPEVAPLSVSEAGAVVWPRPGHDVRFDDPVAAARSFAVFYAGFTDPVVGAFMAGDSRSGEVEVRPDTDPNSPTTTVLVRIMEDDHWYVIGATTPDIVLGNLNIRKKGVCPGTVNITGSALAFEGHVDVRIDSFGLDGSRTEIGRGSAVGSGVPPAGPFETDVTCDGSVSSGPGSDPALVIMVWEDSARDGQRRALTAVPVTMIAGTS